MVIEHDDKTLKRSVTELKNPLSLIGDPTVKRIDCFQCFPDQPGLDYVIYFQNGGGFKIVRAEDINSDPVCQINKITWKNVSRLPSLDNNPPLKPSFKSFIRLPRFSKSGNQPKLLRFGGKQRE